MDPALRERVDELLRAHALPEITRAAVLQLVEQETLLVRQRAVALCVRRGELWRETELRRDRLAGEARARSNEAFLSRRHVGNRPGLSRR